MRALAAEFGKLKHSRMPLWTALAVLGYEAINLALMPVMKDPATVAKMASAGGGFGKALATGMYAPTWENFLRFGAQGISGAWGLYLFGLAAAYLFGRESREGTAGTMLTLPVRREYFVVAKMTVLAVWALGLTLLSSVLHVGVVALIGADGFAWAHVAKSLADTLTVALLVYLTMPLVAWFALLGRGYLPPMLFCVAMNMTGMALVQTSDLSSYFPWSMPVNFIGASWMPVPPSPLVAGSWAVAAVCFAAGLALVMWRADRVDAAR